MAWRVATLHLGPQGCPASGILGKEERLRCLAQRGPGGPCGWLRGRARAPWETLAQSGDASLVRWAEASCTHCPFRSWPAGIPVVSVEATARGPAATLLFREPASLRSQMQALTDQGHEPVLASCSNRTPVEEPRFVVLDLQGMTERQWEALSTAVALGHFEDGGRGSVRDLAKAMAVSRTTAHEHLQKALQKIVEPVARALRTADVPPRNEAEAEAEA